jgi:hypothetical protein
MEAREAGDEVLLGRCDDGRRPQEERRHDDDEDERGGHGEPSSQLRKRQGINDSNRAPLVRR